MENFGVKAVHDFEEAGIGHEAAVRYGTLGFFGGAALTWALNKLADRLVDYSEHLERARRQRGSGSGPSCFGGGKVGRGAVVADGWFDGGAKGPALHQLPAAPKRGCRW